MDIHDKLQAFGDVNEAHRRLVDLGMATEDPAGLNRDGIVTLTDMLSVLVFQTGNGPSHADLVTSATGRAMLAALGDLLSDMAGQPTAGTDTLQLLTTAVRRARS